MRPSLFAPRRRWISISWRGVEAVWLSSRVKMSFEGFLVFQVTKARVDLADSRLLRAEAAADAGLRHTHHGFRDVERVCNDAAGVEDDLCRAQDVQPANRGRMLQ